MLQSLTKSHKKAERDMIDSETIYENSRAVRPLILKVLRFYPKLMESSLYNYYIQTTYNKSNEMIGKIGPEIERLEKYASWSSDYQYQANYLKKFQKNLKKVKKLCEETSISYYNFLPGYKVPLEIRSHIVSFISPVHMD